MFYNNSNEPPKRIIFILTQSTSISMQGTPQNQDPQSLQQKLRKYPQDQAKIIAQEIQHRARYDRLNQVTMSMLKQKEFECYKQWRELAKKLGIKQRRNYEIYFSRLYVFKGKLVELHWDEIDAIQYIFKYMRTKLVQNLEQRYSFCPQLLKQAKEKTLDDIRIMERVLLEEDNSLQRSRQILKQLYKTNKYENLEKKNIKNIDKLLTVILKFKKNNCGECYEESDQQQQQEECQRQPYQSELNSSIYQRDQGHSICLSQYSWFK